MYRLIFHSGRFKGRRIAVQEDRLLIGRDPACAIDLADDDAVSRQHAVLEQREDGVWVRDLGALNATLVNGKPVSEAKLEPGDRLEIGHTVIEFQPIETSGHTARRPLSPLQILTLAAIAFILALEVWLLIFMPKGAAPPPPSTVGTAPGGPQTGTLEAAEQPVPASPPASAGTPNSQAVTAIPPPSFERSADADAEDATAKANRGLAGQTVVTSTVEEVVQSLREQVAGLKQQVEQLAPRPPEPPPRPEERPQTQLPPSTAAAMERPPAEDPVAARIRELLEIAQAEAARGNWTGADQALERILILSPDYLPALVERARLYEKRGLLKEAGDVWARILLVAAGTPLYAEAAAESQRLARLRAIRETARSSTPSAGGGLPRRIRIQSIERERFPGNREIEEMRTVRITVRPRTAEGRIDPEDVRIWVVFYDRVEGGAEVAPTAATAPDRPLRVEPPWGAGEPKTVTAPYIVPRGFRAEEEKRTGARRTYEGFRVQVWYKGVLQDEDAQPKSLLNVPMPDLPPESPFQPPPSTPKAPPRRAPMVEG